MGKNKRLKNQSKKQENILSGQSSLKSDEYNENFRVSFEFLDVTQGESFQDWGKNELLTKMNQTLLEYCKKPIHKQFSSNFKEYGDFPSKSDFHYPKHVPTDVNWASLHIMGKSVLGGFITGNTFFVVFLDKDHRFWKTEKKHT